MASMLNYLQSAVEVILGLDLRNTLRSRQADEQLRRELLRSVPQTGALLTRLPPEIRNMIYNLIFCPDITPGYRAYEVDLLASRPPEHAFLQTCRQVYNEALQLYQVAENAFWTQSHFSIAARCHPLSGLSTISDENLARIQHLTVYGRNFWSSYGAEYLEPVYTLLPGQRGWTISYRVRQQWYAVVLEVSAGYYGSSVSTWPLCGGDFDESSFERQIPLPLRQQLKAMDYHYSAFLPGRVSPYITRK